MNILFRIIAFTLLASVAPGAAADGDLDAGFGASGKVQISAAATGYVASNLSATDVAVQSNGKTIAVGTNENGNCVLVRLNMDGSVDTTFGGNNGFSQGFTGFGGCLPTGIVVRPDDRIAIAASVPGYANAVIVQWTRDGQIDATFGSGGITLIPSASGDKIYASRIALENNGTIDLAGTYYDNHSNYNGYQFLLVQISATGSSAVPVRWEFGSGPNQDDHALDVAVDAQGRYVLAGYHRGTGGNYDFAAIRVLHDLSDVDRSFGSSGQTTVGFDKGGDNGDFCNAVAIFKSSGFIELGGHATVTVGSGTYQAAALATLDSNGNLWHYFSGDTFPPAQLTFAYNRNPTAAGQVNDIERLLVDGYDTKYPQLVAVGFGNEYGVPYGQMFGIARLNPFPNFNFDATFAGNGVEGVYFATRPTSFGSLTTTNYGRSGVLNHGTLVAAGYTAAASGNQMAITRLAAFDGIFKNGFEDPSY